MNAENAMVVLQLALAHPLACRPNLTAVGFGTTFGEMQNLSATRNLTVLIPALILDGPATPIRIGSRLLKTTITGLEFLPHAGIPGLIAR